MHQLWTHRSSLDKTHLELKFSSRMWLWPNTRGGPASFVNVNINMIFFFFNSMCIIIILYSLLLVFLWFWIRKTIYSLLSSYTSSSVGFTPSWLCWCSMCAFNRITRKAGATCLLQMLDSILLGRKAAKLVTVTFDSSLCRCILWWRCFISN